MSKNYIMKYIKLIAFILFTASVAISCKKNVIEYDGEFIDENIAEFQLHYFVPVVANANNNIYKIELNNRLLTNNTSPLVTYNALPSANTGSFFTTTPGNANIKLYKGSDTVLVYDQNVNLTAGKQNVFVHDFSKPPIVFDNQFPYPKNITEHTDSTAWVRFYNFMYENDSTPTILKLQYQYQYTMNVESGQKSDWINVGEPVSFGQSTGWEPIRVIRAVELSSGSARIDYRIRMIDNSGADLGSLQIINSSGRYINYSDWWTAFVGRVYHHVLSGLRTASPRTAVRQFTAR